MTDMIVVRHGETDLNRVGAFQGHVDVPLNELGHAQAQQLAHRLADEPIDLLICSDLLRARQTAQPLAELKSLELHLQPTLREQHFGDLEGLSLDTVRAQFPQVWETWIERQADYRVPGGESVREFSDRVVSCIFDLAARHPDQRLMLVTHGGALDMLYRFAHGNSLHGPRVCPTPNAGINRISVEGRVIQVQVWGDDSHLHG